MSGGIGGEATPPLTPHVPGALASPVWIARTDSRIGNCAVADVTCVKFGIAKRRRISSAVKLN